MLNTITPETVVKGHAAQNLTTFTIEVGLHPKDVDRIINIISKEITEGCTDTKRFINQFNKEREQWKQ
jgi:hypothetical protein